MSSIEYIYVIISSTLIHLFFLVLALFIVYKYYLDKIFIKKYTDNFKYNYNRLIEILVNNFYNDTEFRALMQSLNISKLEAVNEIKNQLNKKLTTMDEKPKNDNAQDKQLLLIPKTSIFILGLSLFIFIFIYKHVYRNNVNLKYSLIEIILSFILTASLVYIYQYYLINNFLIDVIYLRVPRLLKDNLILI